MASIDQLRKEVGKWSLGSDKLLLKHLQELDANMHAQIKALESDMQNLTTETEQVHYTIQNCFNSLMMLSSTQFIENRVYDDEEGTSTKAPDKKEEPEESLVVKFTASLAEGMKALDSYAPPVVESDEEDEKEKEKADSDSETDTKEKKRRKQTSETSTRVQGCLEPTPIAIRDRDQSFSGGWRFSWIRIWT